LNRPLSVAAAWSEPEAAPAVGVGPLRALFVLNSLNVGGSETKTVRLVNALLQRELPSGVAYLNAPDVLRATLDPRAPVWRLERRGKLSFTALNALRRLMREQQPQVVLAVSLYPALYVALAAAGLRTRPRLVASVNTTDFRDGRRWEPSFYAPILRRFDQLIYGCELQRDRWRRLQPAGEGRSRVIYNGVDTEHFAAQITAAERAEARSQLGLPASAFVIGSVGRLAPEKNQAALVDALGQLRQMGVDAHLALAGEGRMRPQLEARIAAAGLAPHATLLGLQSDVRIVLTAIDVFVLPSTRVETFSNAALEAMSMQRPVVLSRIGGAAEMVEDGVEGFTIELEELDAQLAPTLARLYGDRALRETMGRNARMRVEKQFSLGAMLDQYAGLLDLRAGSAA
jgi:glycosyltransferase involved in cell wall biosynthesis